MEIIEFSLIYTKITLSSKCKVLAGKKAKKKSKCFARRTRQARARMLDKNPTLNVAQPPQLQAQYGDPSSYWVEVQKTS